MLEVAVGKDSRVRTRDLQKPTFARLTLENVLLLLSRIWNVDEQQIETTVVGIRDDQLSVSIASLPLSSRGGRAIDDKCRTIDLSNLQFGAVRGDELRHQRLYRLLLWPGRAESLKSGGD